MLIKAMFDGTECYINSNYVIDVIDVDNPYVTAYTIDDNRPAYKITQEEFQRWLKMENEVV